MKLNKTGVKEYNPKKIEPKWQKVWDKKKAFEAKDGGNPSSRAKLATGQRKFYGLIEFPYPSGDGLHVGHIRSNTAMDVISRKRRMEGFNVLYPIGWDAFGLPTENYAIKTGIAPEKVTKRNTDIFRKQLKSVGFSFDWSREINTTDPKYFKWTQWIFLQFLKNDLAYKAKININWCPKDKIGLANEEVIDGKCERCGTPVERREKEQWMLRITKYADRLDKDLDEVDYLEKIKLQQRNWIGRSEGAEIEFELKPEPEPTFYQFFEPGIIRDNEPFVERDAILAVVKHWKENKYIGLKWKKVDWETFITGGVENGQTPEEAARAEILEETGYKNLKLIKKVGRMHSKFFHVPKNQNRFGHFDLFLFELENDEREEMDDKEKDTHDVVWLTPEEIANFKLPSSHRYTWEVISNKGVPQKSVEVFTTRPDTIFGATYLVLAPEHPSVSYFIHQAENAKEIDEYIKNTKKKSELERVGDTKEKTGIELKGVKAINPANQQEIPVFVADYVLATYGTGAVMAVPAHDERDFEFAKKYNLEIREVISGGDVSKEAYIEDGRVVNSGKFNSKNSNDIKKEITEFVGGKWVTKFKLRDWVFSRQRYWGEPIPVVHCEKCGTVPLKEKDLPLKLPKVKNYQPTDNGESPLANISSWVNTKCPVCGSKAKRETDTMPNWAGSSWYFLRYTDPKNNKKFADPKNLKYFMPVDWYNGGMEHTTLHLLYSRFWHKFLYDLKLVSTKEPYKKRTSHGMILAENGEKMSKSRGNVINPDTIVKTYGADTLRVYEMFMGPFDQAISWDTNSISGSYRFLEKVWKLQNKVLKTATTDKKIESLLHKTIQKVSDDIEGMKFNTSISAMMVMVSGFEKLENLSKRDFEMFLKILSPFAPHITEEIWQNLGNKTILSLEKWPKADPKKMVEEEVKIVVQINGKVRDQVLVKVGLSQEEAENMAKLRPDVEKWLSGKEVIKIVYVPNKILNFVVR